MSDSPSESVSLPGLRPMAQLHSARTGMQQRRFRVACNGAEAEVRALRGGSVRVVVVTAFSRGALRSEFALYPLSSSQEFAVELAQHQS
jgi:hypothetical protein